MCYIDYNLFWHEKCVLGIKRDWGSSIESRVRVISVSLVGILRFPSPLSSSGPSALPNNESSGAGACWCLFLPCCPSCHPSSAPQAVVRGVPQQAGSEVLLIAWLAGSPTMQILTKIETDCSEYNHLGRSAQLLCMETSEQLCTSRGDGRESRGDS